MGRGLAAAHVGVVHHVVMDQGAGLQELQGGGGVQGVVEVGTARAEVAPHAERGAQALATGEQLAEPVGEGHEVRGDPGQDLRLLGEEVVEGPLDRGAQVLGGEAGFGRHAAQPRAP